ncbi:MAG: class I SAM-dependent methyltransferase, partial [Bacteroidota bacterium]|nr:class I SAM-dependent methyltransferase [Bacteroidota bacterium]
IDDGGHTMRQQLITFEILYPFLKDDGIYLCEDTHTSYWYEYGGALRRKGTFVEFSKKLVDSLYAWHFKSRRVPVDDFTRSTNAIHFYDSMVFFEKKKRMQPQTRQIGTPSVNHNVDPLASKRSLYHQVIKKIRSFRN